MARKMGKQGGMRAGLMLSTGAAAVLAVAIGLWFRPARPAPQPVVPTTLPSSVPATTTKSVESPPVETWIEVVRRNNPGIATTQPLTFPVDWRDAAGLIIRDPIYLCPRGDLWITRPDAPPTPAVLKQAGASQLHVLRDRVLYVHWRAVAGKPHPTLFIDDAGKLLRVDHNGRRAFVIEQTIDWSRAFSWGEFIVAPTDAGAAVIDPSSLAAQTIALGKADPDKPVRLLLDTRGVLAWRVDGPAARFVDDRWTALKPAVGWPERIVELIPLLDGSVTQLLRADSPDAAPGIQLASAALEPAASMDVKPVVELIDQLSDDDADRRDRASAELSRYGPAIWSILRRLRPEQSLEGQMRIDELLAAQSRPKLGRLSLVADDLQPISYLRDGGVVMYSAAGVETVRGNDTRLTAPAWLAIRPGRSVRLLPAALTADAKPDAARFDAWGDEWIAIDVLGSAQRFMGNHVVPITGESHRRFNQLIGIDSRGRWLLADPTAGETLVIDPFIPDDTPRLPAWVISVPQGSTGWTDDDWPVQKSGSAWALHAENWQPLKDEEPVRTHFTPDAPATAPGDTLLLTETDGTRWFDGQTHLRRDRNGLITVFELPADAIGSMPATLLRAADRLFLFNAPGRVLRLRETPHDPQPMVVEAVFTQDIPTTDDPSRIWLDPAGRIVIAHGENKLTVLFPEGRIPPAIAKMMPARELRSPLRLPLQVGGER